MRRRISAAIKELLKNLDDAQLDLGQAVYEEGLSGQDQSDLKTIVNTITELRDRLMKQKKGGAVPTKPEPHKIEPGHKITQGDYNKLVRDAALEVIDFFGLKDPEEVDDLFPDKWINWISQADYDIETELAEFLAPEAYKELQEMIDAGPKEGEDEADFHDRIRETEVTEIINVYVMNWDVHTFIGDVMETAQEFLQGSK